MIRLIDGPHEALRDTILADLDSHAEALGHSFDPTELAFEATEDGTHLGGLTARIILGWMFVSLLAVSDAARGKGVGRQLMQAAEAEARKRGLTGIWLDTYSFQAPGFYRRLGFTEVGRIDDFPPGESRYFFQKRLAP